MDIKMSPQRPYLLRALFDWLLDNGCTPHVVVDATQPFVEVPQEHVQDGQIVLNVHPDAVTRFTMDLEHISFEARFSGAARRIWLPMVAIVAIYGRENGAGTIFEPEDGLSEGTPPAAPGAPEKISDQDKQSIEVVPSPEEPESRPVDEEEGGTAAKRKGRPSLKVVK